MIQALIWKEYREHRAVWLTLAFVGGAGLFGLTRLMAPNGFEQDPSVRPSLQAVAALLAWTYGLVCGAMLLAGEREGATLTFLDMLPARRLELWLVKFLFGLVLFLAQVIVLAGFVIGLGISENAGQLAGTLLSMLFFGLFGMSWSLLFSARGESVLNVIGLAIGGQIVGLFTAAVLAVPVAILLHLLHLFRGGNGALRNVMAGGLAILALTVAPTVGSARIFSRPDRLRGRQARPEGRQRTEARLWASWFRVLWLSYAQMRRLMLGLMAFALGLGFLVPAAGPVAWPALTLFFGVLCGVTVCADEQVSGSFRFLGDQRFPLGRVWAIKLVSRFALAVVAAFVLLLPSLVRAFFFRFEPHGMERLTPFAGDLLHSSLVGPVVPVGVHLTMWLLYGFTAGQLGGLLFRKSLVAAVVSLGTALTLVCVWVPSLLGIGLHFWQVAGAPLILLATAWFLVPAWAADRLVARSTFVRLAMGLAAVVLWIAGGLWYRVAEVPDVADQLDMAAFVAGIPQPEENTAGQNIRGAWSKAEFAARQLGQKRSAKPLFPTNHPVEDDYRFSTQVSQVLQRGWPAGTSELGDWMDKQVFQTDWRKQLAAAADEPLGVVEDPRRMTVNMLPDRWQSAPAVCLVLAVRGLQLQARGDDETFVKHLRIGLSLARNLQHCAPSSIAAFGRRAEQIWLPALDRWLEKLQGHPELLKETLAILIRHEAELPDPSESTKAGYLIATNTLEEVPDRLLDLDVPPGPHEDARMRQAAIDAAAMLWRMPWERQRHERIVRVAFQGDGRQRREAVDWGGFVLGSMHPRLRPLNPPRGKREVADLHAGQLKTALRLYQAETGEPAARLDLLVPRYLPALPADPFSGVSFGYRLSVGERLGWPAPEPAPGEIPLFPGAPGGMQPMAGAMPGGPPLAPPPPTRFVPKGRGILWSVGEDGLNDGGVRQGRPDFGATFGEDIIYLVPPPPK